MSTRSPVRVALVFCVFLSTLLILARVVELLSGRDHAGDLHLVFESVVTGTIALLVWEVRG